MLLATFLNEKESDQLTWHIQIVYMFIANELREKVSIVRVFMTQVTTIICRNARYLRGDWNHRNNLWTHIWSILEKINIQRRSCLDWKLHVAKVWSQVDYAKFGIDELCLVKLLWSITTYVSKFITISGNAKSHWTTYKEIQFKQHTPLFFIIFLLFMATPIMKDSTPSLFVNSPVLKSLQKLVQNETLWTAPLIIIFFTSLIRWIVALNLYSGLYFFFFFNLEIKVNLKWTWNRI